MAELIVDNVSMIYETPAGEKVEALKDVSFDLETGTFLTILGPSGCGKTTLLNIIAGFLAQTSGDVLFQEQAVVAPSPKRGMVFQQGALFEWISVEKNIGFGPKMAGTAQADIDKTVEYWLNMVGLQNFRQKNVYELSGGMQQRVALARCLANNPELILMDEPLGALDALTREKMQSLLLELWQETGKTIILITHSVEEAIILGERLFVMAPRPGRLEKTYELDFAKRVLESNPRLVKSQSDFIEIREEILSMIWSMEEEIMGTKDMI